jgi:hypothetical protein
VAQRHGHEWNWQPPTSQQTNIDPQRDCGPQVPAPSQSMHALTLHTVPAATKFPQAPLPAQLPPHVASVPHAARPLTGAVPFAVFVHVPGVTSQRTHWPLQFDPQQ